MNTAAEPVPSPTQRGRSRTLLVAAVVLLVVGAIAGAYLDWIWWTPTSGIIVTLAAGALLIVALVTWLTRIPQARAAAVGMAALGIGGLLGQNFGPAREPLTIVDGRMTVTLTSPEGYTVEGNAAYCSTTPSGANFYVTADDGLIVRDPARPDVRNGLSVSVSKGDMWNRGSPRGDALTLIATYTDGGPYEADDAPSTVQMVSTLDSRLEGIATQANGRLEFSGLVADEVLSPGVLDTIPLAGTIEWTCDVEAAQP